jgi:hypothetical protein
MSEQAFLQSETLDELLDALGAKRKDNDADKTRRTSQGNGQQQPLMKLADLIASQELVSMSTDSNFLLESSAIHCSEEEN